MNTREHVTNGLDCWCDPAYMLPCGECEAGCWKCVNGSTLITHEEAETTEAPIVIVHNDTE